MKKKGRKKIVPHILIFFFIQHRSIYSTLNVTVYFHLATKKAMVDFTETVFFKIIIYVLYFVSTSFAVCFHLSLKYEDFSIILNYKQYNNLTKKWEIVNESYVERYRPDKICVITGNQVFR